MSIGTRLLNILESKNISQRQLAIDLNFNPNVISKIINDKRPIRDYEIILISKYLDVSSDFLLGITPFSKCSCNQFDLGIHLDDLLEYITNAHVEYYGQKISYDKINLLINNIKLAIEMINNL